MQLPKGAEPADEQLVSWVRSKTCPCKAPKQEYSSLCRDCYMTLPQELRLELWRPWTNDFSKYYTEALDYLGERTTRFTCQKSTSSRQTSTLNSGKAKKSNSGKRSLTTQSTNPPSASAPETSQPSDCQKQSTQSTSQDSVKDSIKLSTSQVIMSITGATLTKFDLRSLL